MNQNWSIKNWELTISRNLLQLSHALSCSCVVRPTLDFGSLSFSSFNDHVTVLGDFNTTHFNSDSYDDLSTIFNNFTTFFSTMGSLMITVVPFMMHSILLSMLWIDLNYLWCLKMLFSRLWCLFWYLPSTVTSFHINTECNQFNFYELYDGLRFINWPFFMRHFRA